MTGCASSVVLGRNIMQGPVETEQNLFLDVLLIFGVESGALLWELCVAGLLLTTPDPGPPLNSKLKTSTTNARP